MDDRHKRLVNVVVSVLGRPGLFESTLPPSIKQVTSEGFTGLDEGRRVCEIILSYFQSCGTA